MAKNEKKNEKKKDVSKLVQIVEQCKQEAKDAKFDRMELNKRNFDAFHLRQDWTHKREGQSREFLGKTNLATQQIASFIQQGLIDVGDWFGVGAKPGVDESAMMIKPKHCKAIMQDQHEVMGYHNQVDDMMKLGLLGSLVVVKVHGQTVDKPKFIVTERAEGIETRKVLERKENKVWELRYELVRQEDWYPDPTGRGVYCVQTIEMDYHELLKLAEQEDSPYDLSVVKNMSKDFGADFEQQGNKQRETGQNTTEATSSRCKVIIDEFWGDIVDPTSGKILHENVMFSVANECTELHKPIPNPFWHQKKPYIVKPLMRVPHSVWHKAIMDAAASHNATMNEVYNLMVDGAMMGVHGIKQLRKGWLDDEGQVADGIPAGATLDITSAVPPGAKVLERVDTSSVPQEALQMFNVISSEFNQSAFTNDLRLGSLPQRSVKATEVVEASQSITSVFSGISKNIETGLIEPEIEMGWMVTAQHIKMMDQERLKALLGDKDYTVLANMSAEEIFAETVNGFKFKVFGITRTLNKIKDYRKLQGLLQTIGGSEIMLEAFARKYDLSKLLDEVIKSLDIDTGKIVLDANMMPDEQMMGQQGGVAAQTQVPQAGAEVNTNQGEEGGVPRSEFPGSRALAR